MINTKNDKKNILILKILFLILIVIAPLLIVWIIYGEWNSLGLNTLVGIGGKNWGPIVNDDGTDAGIGYGISKILLISWEPFVIPFIILVIDILIFILIFLINKKITLFFIPFIISTWLLFYSIIITGLLVGSSGEFWKYIIRFFIIAFSFMISFFIVNKIVNLIIANTHYGELYANEIINENNVNKKYIDKNFINKKKKEITSVEIDEKDI